MGWLVGLPLGLFRLLGSILLVALRFAVPILILVAVILVLRLCAAHFRWGLPHAADLPE